MAANDINTENGGGISIINRHQRKKSVASKSSVMKNDEIIKYQKAMAAKKKSESVSAAMAKINVKITYLGKENQYEKQ